MFPGQNQIRDHTENHSCCYNHKGFLHIHDTIERIALQETQKLAVILKWHLHT